MALDSSAEVSESGPGHPSPVSAPSSGFSLTCLPMRDLAAVSIPVLINQRNIEGEGDRQGGLLNSGPADPVSAPVLGPNESVIVSFAWVCCSAVHSGQPWTGAAMVSAARTASTYFISKLPRR
jgi:hypothetical protein